MKILKFFKSSKAEQIKQLNAELETANRKIGGYEDEKTKRKDMCAKCPQILHAEEPL